MTCLITGCLLRNGHQSVGGDLHIIAGAYVFNAITNDKGEAAWCADDRYAHYDKEVDVVACSHYFERRGVAVFGRGAALNSAALQYLHASYLANHQPPRRN